MAAPQTEEELRDWLAEMIFEGTYGPDLEADIQRIRTFTDASGGPHGFALVGVEPHRKGDVEG